MLRIKIGMKKEPGGPGDKEMQVKTGRKMLFLVPVFVLLGTTHQRKANTLLST